MNWDSRTSRMPHSAVLIVVFVAMLAIGFSTTPAPARAGVINYTVSVNTTDLRTSVSDGPYAAVFDLQNGGALGEGNGITASNFAFPSTLPEPDGSPAGNLETSLTGASGNLGTSVSLNDAGLDNYLIQEFNPGDLLNFDLSVNVANPSSDFFSFAFLQNYMPGFGDPVLTNDPDYMPPLSFFSSVFTIDFNDALNPTVSIYTGDAPFGNVTATVTEVSPAPEPGTWAMMAMGLVGMIFFAWRRKRDAARGLAVAAPSQSCA